MTLRKSDAAAADLEKIWLDSARDYGLTHAARVIGRFDDLFSHLLQFPDMGRQHPHLRPGIRFFPVKPYPFIVFFTHDQEGTLIVRILHTRQDVEPAAMTE